MQRIWSVIFNFGVCIVHTISKHGHHIPFRCSKHIFIFFCFCLISSAGYTSRSHHTIMNWVIDQVFFFFNFFPSVVHISWVCTIFKCVVVVHIVDTWNANRPNVCFFVVGSSSSYRHPLYIFFYVCINTLFSFTTTTNRGKTRVKTPIGRKYTGKRA